MSSTQSIVPPSAVSGASSPPMPSTETAMPAFPPVEALLGARHRTRAAVLASHRRRGLRRLVERDPLVALSLAIALSVLTMLVLDGPRDPWLAVALTAAFVALEIVLARVPAEARIGLPLRFGLVFVYLPLAGFAIDPSGGSWPVNSLMIPAVALAAALWSNGMRLVIGLLVVLLAIALLPDGASVDLSRRLVALAMACGVTAFGSRRVVDSLERSRDRLRRAQSLQRRRTRQLGAVERVGQILARDGATAQALDGIVGLLDQTFGYKYPSVYLWDGRILRLGAQANYAAPIEVFAIERGVIGRVARTRQAVFLPDVSVDPDYVAADDSVAGEISLPLVAGDDLLGVLNVEMGRTRRLDTEDFATMQIVADRVAASLALGRERQKLTERARLMDRLASFSQSLSRTLDPETLHQSIAAGARRVVEADVAILALVDRESGELRTVEVDGGDEALRGVTIQPGEGATGRAFRDGRPIVIERLDRPRFPGGYQDASVPDSVTVLSAPLIAEREPGGAVSWFRADLSQPFSDQEREIAGLLALQVALAIANAELHHATEVAAITDGLTGLNNRRYFDAAMARTEAARAREPEAERHPRAVILFDLDHFGQINKFHGHQVGDRMLKAFADVLRARLRASDLVARYGGEEFIVVLERTSRIEAMRIAEAIRETFEGVRFALPDGSAVNCTVSAGCSALTASETAGSLVLGRADVGLAMAKSSGRNRVVAA